MYPRHGRVPKVALHHQFLRYGFREVQHEAGYDAFLTAKVFLALAAEMSGCGRSNRDLTSNRHLTNGAWAIASDLPITGVKKYDIGKWKGEESGCAPFDTFEGGIFEDLEGLLSVNGTIEGCIKLQSKETKQPLEFVLFEELGYDSCVEDD